MYAASRACFQRVFLPVDQSVTCVWQGHEAPTLRRARQVWRRAKEQPEEEAVRDPGPQVGQEGHHLLVRQPLPNPHALNCINMYLLFKNSTCWNLETWMTITHGHLLSRLN